MRRALLVIVGLVLAAAMAAGAYWLAKRKVRWNDARTMPPPLSAAVRAYGKGDAGTGEASVRTLLTRYRAPAWEPRARVLAATHLARAGRPREITGMLPRDLPESDPLAGEAMLLRAQGLLAGGAAEPAASLAENGRGDTGVSRRPTKRGWFKLERWPKALAGGTRFPCSMPQPTPAAAIEAARIAAAHGDREGARRRLVASLLAAESDADVERVGQAFSELFPDAPARFTAAERPKLAERASRLLEDSRSGAALSLVRLPRPAGAPSAATPAEALVEAEALLKLGRAAEMGALLAHAAKAGDAATQAGARYLEARRAGAAGRFGAYRSGLLAVAARPITPWQERALLDIAHAVEGAPSASTLAAYQRYRTAAGSRADPLALLREAWAAYDLKRFAEAEAGFARALARPDAPNGVRVTANYWRARMAEAGGRLRRSAEALRRGRRRLRKSLLRRPRGEAAGPCASGGSERDSQGLPILAGSRRAASWSRSGSGTRRLRTIALRSRTRDRVAVSIAGEAAEAAKEAAALSDAIGFAQDAVGDRDRTPVTTVPLPLWRLLYPAGAAEALTRAAKSHGLDPNLVAAVALQESAYNPLAVSSAGARGLLQIMPPVGAELARAMGLRRFDPSDLFDPEINLRFGSRHLSDYKRRFGSIPRGLAAFNGGPARVTRWSLPAGTDDDERFVERIPIPETRLYVKRVMAGARMYAIAWPNGLGVE